MKIIIIYSSVDGQTRNICEYIKSSLTVENQFVEILNINNTQELKVDEILDYDKIIIASSIRYGKHNKKIENFIQENYEVLNSKKTAFISVNLVARKTEKSEPTTNPYVIKFLNSIQWKPTIVAVFAGKLNYKIYTFTDRILIKLIMLITKGPVNSKTEIEYTDWEKVDSFVRKFDRI